MAHRSADERAAEEVSQHGLRATRQRVAALRTLRRMKNHPTSAELHARSLLEHENLSRKTVYEILDALVDSRLAAHVTASGGPRRYQAAPEPHYHATCRAAGGSATFPRVRTPRFAAGRNSPEGFRVEEIDLAIRGVCSRCQGRR